MTENIFDFIGGESGQWKVVGINTVTGESLEQVSHVKIVQSSVLKLNE